LDAEVFIGGPVEQNTLHFIYFGVQLMEESRSLGNEVWWGGDFPTLVQLINSGKLSLSQVRFFLGYSGWSPGQLEDEFKDQTWIVYSESFVKELFENSAEHLWRCLMKRLGGEFEIQSNYPTDPRLN
jgi:putative transcriptional regulator